MARITRDWARPFAIPIPKSAPQETWVVDTGMPHLDANITKTLVTTLAQSPCSGSMPVIFLLTVCATALVFNKPPNIIVTATSKMETRKSNALATSPSATILGVSFSPRAKLTATSPLPKSAPVRLWGR